MTLGAGEVVLYSIEDHRDAMIQLSPTEAKELAKHIGLFLSE